MKVDPKNPDVVYAANTSTYRSTDGGKTFTAIKGAPGGDDYHTIWINPDNPEIILLASDQGATITVNGGKTWSSWYNQPTAQFYHVITDNQFPVLGLRRPAGERLGRRRRAAATTAQITFRDWHPVGVEEYGYVAPDPLDPDIVYGGKLTRFDRRTGEVQDISPAPLRGKYRFVRTMPVLFSPVDPHALYLGSNVIFKTRDGGRSLGRHQPRPDARDLGDARRASASSPRRSGEGKAPRRHLHGRAVAEGREPIWAGTDDGLIHVTRDGGKTWANVTPPALTPWSKVSLIDAAHFDAQTAYAAVNRFRLDDLKPHIYRTHDGGKTWQEIVQGLPDNAPVNAVREDPVRKGLLFAGTERAVFVSFDDGDHWQPLRLNMPATSIRDLVVHGDDLVVGHARPLLLDPRRHHAAAADRRRRSRPADVAPLRRSRPPRPLEH